MKKRMFPFIGVRYIMIFGIKGGGMWASRPTGIFYGIQKRCLLFVGNIFL